MKKIRLYDYQRDMLRDIINMLTAQSLQVGNVNGKKVGLGNSVMVQMPTGTGKTYVMASVVEWFLDRYDEGEVWIVAHRRELVEQMQLTLDRFCLKYGEKEATLTISVKGLTPKKKFGFKIDVDEAYADPYTKQDGSTVLQSSVLVSQWTKVLENVQFYYAGFTDLPVTYSDIYQLEGVNQFYITNMLGSGADLYFKIDGTFNADNLADCSGELVPEEGKGAAIYDYQTYKQNYIVAGVDSSTGDYLWNWTVGDVNINSFMWYGGYGYSTYSYIDFTQKYIYLNGYINSSVEQQSVNVYGVW